MEIYQLVSIILIIIGIVMTLYQLYMLSRIKKSKYWQLTKGEIISSKINTFNSIGESDKTYKAEINYKYTIEGNEYISNRVFFGDKIRSGTSLRAIKLINKYFVGCKVDIYYNPDNLEDAILERGINRNIIVLLVVGIFLVGVGIIILHYHPYIKTFFSSSSPM